jgi:tetratricopeptide (TPR) repeat protein
MVTRMLRTAQRAQSRWASFAIFLIFISVLTVQGALAAPSPGLYLQQAIALYNKGDCVKAIGLLKKAIAADPKFVRAYTWMGFCYAKLGRSGDAIEAFNRVVALAPRSDDARLAREWISRLEKPAAKPTQRPAARPTRPPIVAQPTPAPMPTVVETGPVYLAAMASATGINDDNRARQVQLAGETYRRALVERRSWWQGKLTAEREWKIVFTLQGRYIRFHALAGVEDGAPLQFTASFEVRGDGRLLFEGQPKYAGEPPDSLDIDVNGVQRLELLVRGKDLLHSREVSVIWADPYLDPRLAAPAPVSSPPGP